MTSQKIRTLFIACSVLILALALAFGSVLSTGSFIRNLTESYVSSYAINGGESVRKIEFALKYGKKLDNFYGIQNLLQEVKDNSADVTNVKVVLANGRIAYSLKEEKSDALTGSLLTNLKQMMLADGKSTAWQVVDHQYNTLVAIKDPTGVPIGVLDIQFDESVVTTHANAFEQSIMSYTWMVGLIAAAALVLLLMRMQITDPQTGKLRTRQLLTVILLVIGVAQATLTTNAILEFQPVYLSTVQRNQELVGRIVQKNIEKVIAKGVHYAELANVVEFMDAIPRVMPEIESISLATSGNEILFSTHRDDKIDDQQYLASLNPVNVRRVNLAPDAAGVDPRAGVALSRQYMESQNRSIVVDAITLLVTTILFSVEIVLFLGLFFHRQALGSPTDTAQVPVHTDTDIAIVRPQAFFFFLSASMATSFLPIILKGIDPIFGLPENVMLGLPLTVELVASIISTLVTGVVLDRRGWRPPFILGLALLGGGTLLSALSSTTMVFLLSRMVVGVGYGFAWMALRGYVASGKSQQSQATGFAGLNAGIYAGINCGVILGALLVERLAYAGVFWLSLLLAGVAMAFCLVFTKNHHPTHAAEKALSSKPAAPLLADRSVLLFFGAIAVPTAICLMFLNYFVPVYAKSIGISSGDVGRLFLLYGLCVVYLGPWLSSTVIQKYSAKLSSAISFALIIGGLLLFGFMPSPLTCTIAVLLLGLSDGLGLVAQNNYYLSLDSVKRFGIGKSMGVFSIVRKIGQSIGPSVFAWLTLIGAGLGIGLLGVVFAIALLIFIALAPSKGKRASV